MLTIVDVMKKNMLDDITMQHGRHGLVMSFVQKVISVLLAEAFSNTVYTVLLIYMEDQKLVARTIYAVFVTIYSPFTAWLITKCSCAQGANFLASSLQLHATICPVFVAWGWKDWANEVHEKAGKSIAPDLILASSATLVIICLQAMPCFIRYQKAVASGGKESTLLARYATLPATLNLTVGFCWNLTATHPIGKLQDEFKSYGYKFSIQMAYAVLIGVIAIALHICAGNRNKSKSIIEIEKTHQEKEAHHHAFGFHSFGQNDSAVSFGRVALNCMVTILAFVYAWAFLDSVDDFAFGIMFRCASYSKCSQEANFVTAAVVTAAFIPSAMVMHKCREHETYDLTTIIGLQLNAMMLTVGWMWMDWYTVFMDAMTAEANKNGSDDGIIIMIYCQVFAIFLVFTSALYFIFKRTDMGLTKHAKEVADNFASAAETSQAELQSLKAGLKKANEEIALLHSILGGRGASSGQGQPVAIPLKCEI
jgi:hypothetical protein